MIKSAGAGRTSAVARGLACLALASAAMASLGMGDIARAADDKPGRYSMTPTDGGFIRLDTETGAVSLCAKKDAGWACELMPDGQTAARKELDALKAENKALKDEIKRMEEVFALGDRKPGDGRPGGDDRPGGARGKLELPTEQDVDKAFDYFEKMMKKFRERMKRIEEGEKPGQRL